MTYTKFATNSSQDAMPADSVVITDPVRFRQGATPGGLSFGCSSRKSERSLLAHASANLAVVAKAMRVFTSNLLPLGVCLVLTWLTTAAAYAAPDPNWTVDVTVADCSGPSQQGDPACDDYASDLYEQIDYRASAPGTADIQAVRTGYDADYFCGAAASRRRGRSPTKRSRTGSSRSMRTHVGRTASRASTPSSLRMVCA
jgi:hypothetical protein